jgi:glucan biosynthesis protein C
VSSTSSSGSRLFYLDWLRVIAIICVFFFHNARFYDTFSDWHIKNATTNVGATAFVALMNPWMMPLFFLISGAGTYYALRNRSIMQYIGERSLRILIPLIFGMLVIVVPQAYFQASYHGELPGGYNFFQIYGLYLSTLPELNFFHLWFLAYLFVFSIVSVPLLGAWVKGGISVISRIAAYFHKPWALVLLVVLPLAAADAFLSQDNFFGSRSGSGGWSIVAHIQFFVFGYMIFANPRIMESIKKMGWFALGSACVTAALLLTIFFDYLVNPADHFGTPMYILAMTLEAINTWSFLIAILALAGNILNRTNKFLNYANEAVLPFYILHQTVIVSIGYYIIPQDWGVGLKYLIISSASFVAIMAVYELIRRVNVLRFLFGMRWIKKRGRELVTGKT